MKGPKPRDGKKKKPHRETKSNRLACDVKRSNPRMG